MRRYELKAFLIISSFLLLLSAQVYAIDPPHITNTTGFSTDRCLRCHDSSKTPGLVANIGTSIDNTATNLICRGCHEGVAALNAMTHSSLTTDNSYGTWTSQCITCHDPHYQMQYRKWKSDSFLKTGTVLSISSPSNTITVNTSLVAGNWVDYILIPNTRYMGFSYRIIGNTGDTITVQRNMNTRYARVNGTFALVYGQLVKSSVAYNGVANSVKLFNGSGDFGPGSSTNKSTSVCYVCHTKTTKWSPDGVLHYDKKPCLDCHEHAQGLVGSCDECHGNPPESNTPEVGGLVFSPSVTNSKTGAAHIKHSSGGTNHSYVCGTCHYNGMPATPVEDNNKIQIGFYLFNGERKGTGTYYKGQILNDPYSYEFTNGTAVGGTELQCSNIYCHGSIDSSAWGGGANITPLWNAVGQVACGDCHKATASVPPTLGNHPKHSGASPNLNYACSLCHSTYTSPSVHANNRANVSFSGDQRVSDGSYSGTTTMLDAYGNCSNIYCHSNVQTSPPGGSVTYKTPLWGGSVACGDCHKADGSPTLMNSGSHTKHVSDYGARFKTCSTCHTDAGTGTTKHGDRSIDVSIDLTYNGSYSGSNGPGDAYGNCSNNYCHSTGGTSPTYKVPTWGDAGTGACGTCHGATSGTPPSTGNHAKHAGSTEVYQYKCYKCHTDAVNNNAPATISTKGFSTYHVNTTSDVTIEAYTANSVPGGGIYNTTADQCSNNYCHSNAKVETSAEVYNVPTWGGTLSCTSCHSTPPSYTNGGAGTSTANSHPTHGTECQKCHNQTTSNGTSIRTDISPTKHVNANIQDVFFNSMNPDAIYTAGTKSCSTTYCHGTGTPQWGGVADCGSCHKAKTGVSGQSLAAEHAVHYNSSTNATSRDAQNLSSATNYIFNCGTCHDVQPTVEHLDGSNQGKLGTNGYVVDVIFNVSWVSLKTGAYSNGSSSSSATGDSGLKYWTNGTCSNLYCHSDAKASPTYQSVTWTGSAMTCKSCHGGPELNASVTLSVKHAKHVATDALAYGFRCIECHTGTVGLNNTSITVFSNHIGIKNVVFYSSMRDSGVDQSGGTYTSGTKTCSSLYCHSNANPLGGGNAYQSPVWDTTTTTCSSCHGSPGGSIAWSPAHDKHTETYWANYTCNNCHSTTASSNTVIISNAVHVNGLKNVSMSSFSSGTYTAETYSCSNVYCHSAGTSISNSGGQIYTVPVWSGGALACNGCHGNPPAYTNKQPKGNSHAKHTTCEKCHYTVTTNGTAITSPSLHANNGASYDVKNAPGVSNFTYTFKNMPALSTCSNTYCHASSIPEWGGASMTCSSCHKAHTGGGAGTNLAASHAFHYNTTTDTTARTAINNSVNNRYIFNCGVCHDVDPTNEHSDGSNQGALGTNGYTVDVIFNVPFAPSGYKSGKYNAGTTTATGDSGFLYYDNSSCSSVYCHSSVQGTTGGAGPASYGVPSWPMTTLACNQCHANPPATGNHTTHTSAPLSYACTVCHKNFSSQNVGHVNGIINVTIDTTNYGAAANYTQGNNAPGNGYSDCSSVYCHGAWGLSGGTDNTPVWGDATTGDCGDCHAATAASPPPGGSHTRHAGASVPPNLNLLCFDCHGANGNGAIGHENLSVSWVMNTANTKFSSYATYNGTISGQTGLKAPSASYKTCSGIYCHSNVQAPGGLAAPTTYGTPTWGGAVTCSDGGCHSSVDSGMPASGSHGAHVNATTYAYVCNDCHNGYGDETASHANRTINYSFSAANAGTITNYTGDGIPNSGAYGSCSNTRCHGKVFGAWGAASLAPYDACTICHGTKSGPSADGSTLAILRAPGGNNTGVDTAGSSLASDANVGAHDIHLDTAGLYNSLGVACTECHQVPAVTNVGINGHFGQLPADITWGTNAAGGTEFPQTPSYAQATLTCSGTYCHAKGSFGGTGLSPAWNNTAYLSNSSSPFSKADCGQCHAYPPGSHGAGDTDCSGCHTHTDADDYGFSGVANRALHINRIVEGGDCVACHKDIKGSRRIITGASGEFHLAWGHVNATRQSAGKDVKPDDCCVCHMEGIVSTGAINATLHKDNKLQIRNADSGDTISTIVTGTFERNLGSATLEAFALAVQNEHCLSCHDSNGASSTGAQVTGGSANDPFFSGRTEAILDVRAEFSNTNASFHPVLFNGNNDYCDVSTMNTPWNQSAKTPKGSLKLGNKITCFDCHAPANSTGNITKTPVAHGAAQTTRRPYDAQDKIATQLCIVCHKVSIYWTNTTHVRPNSGSALTSGTSSDSNWDTYHPLTRGEYDGCTVCHGATTFNTTTDVGGTLPVRPRTPNVHGSNVLTTGETTWPASGLTGGQATKPYSFLRYTSYFCDYWNIGTGSGTARGLCENMCNGGRDYTYGPAGRY
ncbi:MAG: CxxxxCH/CxxCH domain-containing protein [Nitrospirae bacterium]|nr:CxxxxCH/CxxCH domain-containing protein [Nitrospirota bacterium]